MSGNDQASKAGPVTLKTNRIEEDDDADGRTRSRIQFPYMDLGAAVEVAQAIHQNVGPGSCSSDQLAAWLNFSPKSSSFRVQTGTAKMFGLVESQGDDHELTTLGRKIVDPKQVRAAKVESFLEVPLYKAVYERFKGESLPPDAALERTMVELGVAPKQTGRARSALQKSAAEAGFFEQGRDRLVKPGIAPTRDAPADDEKPRGSGSGGGGRDDSELHPFIQGLLTKLPVPDTEWDAAGRVKWLQTAANIFDLMYKGDGGIEVRSAIAPRSPRPQD